MTLSAGVVGVPSGIRKAAGEADPTENRRRRVDWRVWLYTVPVLLVFTFVFIGPLIFTVWTALHDTTYFQIGEFSGLNSFVTLFTDPSLPAQIGTTLVFSLGALIVALPAG
ncbi:MAG: hypothetical protein ACT6ST_11650, partial [Microbacterium aurantiacum]